MTTPWMLDELAHAGPEHLDPDFVAGYEREQGYPDPAEDLAVLAAARRCGLHPQRPAPAPRLLEGARWTASGGCCGRAVCCACTI